MTDTTFFRAAGVFDAVRPGLVYGAGLLVSDGRVAAVGPPDEACPPGARQVDLGAVYLVPGFVDAHTHVTIRPGEGDQHGQLQRPAAWQTVRGVDNLRRMLASGVTTARVMTEEHDIDVHFKAAVAAGEVAGPRLRVAGRGLSPTGKHGSAAGGVDGADGARAAVRANAAKGADHIKIFTTGGVSSTDTSLEESNYSADEIAAIVETAAELGLMVSAHAHGGAGVDLAAAAGVRSVEHGALLTERNIATLVAHGTWLVLTSTILFHPTGIEQGDAAEPAILAKVQQARASMEAAVGRIRAAGLPIALGTDSMHGLFGYELQWLVAHGWSAEEALLAGTVRGAELMGVTDIGALAPGRRADFVALRRDPLQDIDAVREVAGVYRDGRLVVDADGLTRPAPSS
ncbi:amidohydrolase family protein [Jiangella alba]|uniref:Imidazolonepropionase n=1 Tax=Jiangella alba TaxID=561176 RepID=A0A1H5PNU0_9ACTN|nr:amidohydrolase family protein [Jiangella alba]SEF15359.1 Imidazolonepropionase [Jiangella alba]